MVVVVEASKSQIKTADEGKLLINDDHLLVVGPQPVDVKAASVAHNIHVWSAQFSLCPLRIVGQKRRLLMVQEDTHSHTAVGSVPEELGKSRIARVAVAEQRQVRLDHPAQDEDLMPRKLDGLPDLAECGSAIHNESSHVAPEHVLIFRLLNGRIADGCEGAVALLTCARRGLGCERDRVAPTAHIVLHVAAAETELQHPRRTADQDPVLVVPKKRKVRVEEKHVDRVLVHHGLEKRQTVLAQHQPALLKVCPTGETTPAITRKTKQRPPSATRTHEVLRRIVAPAEAATLLLCL
mmetsp:Transcript_29776/g.79140  ORF Transcript_29776/g.79140 Transcript_29776/m.79140 type:complete len:295 (-) Transcript_29776:901-1785(-)